MISITIMANPEMENKAYNFKLKEILIKIVITLYSNLCMRMLNKENSP